MKHACAIDGCNVSDDLHSIDGAELCSEHARLYMHSGEGKRAEKLANVAMVDFIRRLSAERMHSPTPRLKPQIKNGAH